MKYILNSREMKQCDMRTIEHYGIPSMVLMERAALSVVSFLHEKELHQKKIGILCGGGNNGADGLAIARLLYLEGAKVTVFQSKDASHKSQENKKQFDICNNYGIKISDDLADILTCEVVLDALFGIGLSRDITGENAQLLLTLYQWMQNFH